MEYSKELLAKIGKWSILKKQLADIKAKEGALRAEVYKALFEDGKTVVKEGKNKRALPDGWTMAATVKYNYTLDEATLEQTLDIMRKKGFQDHGIVNYKPSLSLTEYRKISDDMKTLFSAALTVKPGTPALELVPPKEKK